MLGIVAAVIIYVIQVSCNGPEIGGDTITYKGRVVTLTGNQPMADVTARITDGRVVRASMVTQTDGLFRLTVVIKEIDENFYLELVDKNGKSKKGQLRAFGVAEYDYGDIPLGDVVPSVETVGITAMSASSFTCRCNVLSQGNARVTERGLCWATNVPTIDDYKVPSGSGMGEFFCTVENAGIDINTTTYYARAYATNEYGVGYGEPVELNSSKLAYYSLPQMEFGGYTYTIHPDLGGMKWDQANAACEDLNAYGYDDWYLPNKEELFAVAEKTNVLSHNSYWTSSDYGSARYYLYYYSNGSSGRWESAWTSNYSSAYRTIPVRKSK